MSRKGTPRLVWRRGWWSSTIAGTTPAGSWLLPVPGCVSTSAKWRKRDSCSVFTCETLSFKARTISRFSARPMMPPYAGVARRPMPRSTLVSPIAEARASGSGLSWVSTSQRPESPCARTCSARASKRLAGVSLVGIRADATLRRVIRELFHIGPVSISPFGVMLMLAFLAAYAQLSWGLKRLGAGNADDASTLMLWGGLAGIVGGKVYYAVLYRDWHLLFDRSGLVWYGGFVLGTAAVVWVIWRRRLPAWPTL